MYPITSAVKALYDTEQRQFLRITGTDKNGASINITDANVVMGGFNIDRFSCNGEKLEVGTAIAAEMTLKLDNHNGTFNGIVFEGTELFVEIGIGDPVNWMPCGYFTPDQQPRTANQITIHALDRMTRFDAVHPTLTPWTDNNGNQMTDGNGNVIYFCAELAFPCTVSNLVEQCCIRCEMPFDQSLSSLPNYNYTLNSLPDLQQDITFRQIIQWCAGIMGTCAYIDWAGKLIFKWYSAASYATTTANRFQSDLYENDLTITGVQYTNTQGVNIVSGELTYALDMTGNYLAASGIATILPAVNTALNGFSYRPFTATVIAAPYLWPLDVITFTDKDGNDHSCPLTNVNFGLNGATVIESKGMTAQLNSAVAPAAVTSDEARLIEGAYEATEKLNNSLDQEGVFNRLTNNGTDQGVILYDGRIYINAEYIQTGYLSASRIKGGELTLGGSGNTNGTIDVKDAQGNTIGWWNRQGLGVTDGGGLTIGSYSDGSRIRTLSVVPTWDENRRVPSFQFEGYTENRDEYIVSISPGFLSVRWDEYDPDDDSYSDKYEMKFDAYTGRLIMSVDGHSKLYLDLANLRFQWSGDVVINGNYGASGTFTTADNKTVTVTNGIITRIY